MPILACICKRRANNLQSERDHTRSFKAYDPDLPFQAPEGKKLEISSSLFGIHPSKDCKYDYLAITGVRNKKIVKCGKREFKHVTKSNRALFQFKSSKKVNARPFVIRIKLDFLVIWWTSGGINKGRELSRNVDFGPCKDIDFGVCKDKYDHKYVHL